MIEEIYYALVCLYKYTILYTFLPFMPHSYTPNVYKNNFFFQFLCADTQVAANKLYLP